MALALSKLFMRTISQNPNENQTGISLWSLEDVHKAQAKRKEAAEQSGPAADDYDDGGLSDGDLGEMDLDF